MGYFAHRQRRSWLASARRDGSMQVPDTPPSSDQYPEVPRACPRILTTTTAVSPTHPTPFTLGSTYCRGGQGHRKGTPILGLDSFLGGCLFCQPELQRNSWAFTVCRILRAVPCACSAHRVDGSVPLPLIRSLYNRFAGAAPLGYFSWRHHHLIGDLLTTRGLGVPLPHWVIKPLVASLWKECRRCHSWVRPAAYARRHCSSTDRAYRLVRGSHDGLTEYPYKCSDWVFTPHN